MRLKPLLSMSALSCVLLVTGCSLMASPVVGDWSGKITASQSGGMGAMMGGFTTAMMGDKPAELSLKADGSGYLKIPNTPERPVTWKMDGERVLLYASDDKGNAKKSSTDAIIGKLSEDKKTLTFDLGPIQFAMTKQAK